MKTIASLRELPAPADGTVASVAGYHFAGDSGGGRFTWRAGSSQTSDGGFVIEPIASASGRWVRTAVKTILPAQFGAKGDGVTDDAPALRAAFDHFARNPEANHFHFPRGKYYLNSYIPFSHPDGAHVIIPFGDTGMTGRRLKISGAKATLFSNISPQAVPILFVRAAFKSLQVVGLNFEKTSKPLQYSEAPAEGINMTAFDRREIESIELTNCQFINCHRSFSVGLYLGSAVWGKIRRFDVRNCKFLYPYGANALDGYTGYTGHQMTFGGAWIHTMVYRGCVFDGASLGWLEEETCPGHRVIDGGHFGGPHTLIFEHNVVRHFSVEGVFKTNDRGMEGTQSSFTVPPSDNSSDAEVLLQGRDSIFRSGMRFYMQGVGDFEVLSHDPATRLLRFTNPGGPRNVAPGTLIGPDRILIDLDYSKGFTRIAHNSIDGEPPIGALTYRGGFTGPGSPGIAVHDTPAEIVDNIITGCQRGISIYDEMVPGIDDSKGSLITRNDITVFNPLRAPSTFFSSGIYVESDENVILNNVIRSPHGRRFYGAYTHSKGVIISGNRISSVIPHRLGYSHPERTTGILLGNPSNESLVFANTTSGMDVGAGADAYQDIPFRLGTHRSLGDGLGADIRALTGSLSSQEEALQRSRLRTFRVQAGP